MKAFTRISQSPIFWFSIQGCSGIFLTLLNKQLTSNLPSSLSLLCIQNTFSFLLFLLFHHLNILPIHRLNKRHLIYALPTTALFVMLIWTSMESLGRVSITLIIVTRNLVPLLTGLVEQLLFGVAYSLYAYFALGMIFLGSVIYCLSDLTVSSQGVTWVLLNMCFSVLIPVFEKRVLVAKLKLQTPTGMNLYRNLLSVPMLIVIAYMRNEFQSENVQLVLRMSPALWLSLFGSCLFGFTIGLAYFFLLTIVSETSTIAVANNFFKLCTMVAGFVFYGVTFSSYGWLGITLSFIGIIWYTRLHHRQKQTETALLVKQKQSILP